MTFKQVLPIWWSFFWRSSLVGFLAGIVAGFVIGFVFQITGYGHLARQWGSIAGLLVGIPVSLWALKATLEKHRLFPAPH